MHSSYLEWLIYENLYVSSFVEVSNISHSTPDLVHTSLGASPRVHVECSNRTAEHQIVQTELNRQLFVKTLQNMLIVIMEFNVATGIFHPFAMITKYAKNR